MLSTQKLLLFAVLALLAPAAGAQTPTTSAPAEAAAPTPIPTPPADAIAQPCSDPAFRQFDFWVGRWSVSVADKPPQGYNEITRVAQGCALQERYHNKGGYTGTSLNFHDAKSGTWTQVWVDNSGLLLRLTGKLDEQGRMVLSGDRIEEGKKVWDRITWVAMPDGTVQQIWDMSKDGQSWENAFTGIYRRVEG